jgi:actin-like ATPase involved in cell morphogenesis
MTYPLGIDLGTTYTAAAVVRNGRAEVAALGYRATSVPTVVLLTGDGRFLVGDAAERRAGNEPDRVARQFKRRVGDPTPLLLGGTPIAVDRCMAEVLRWVVATVGQAEGGPPGAVTVTHPANWGDYKRDVLREALRMVEIPHARLMPEPLAAATWYAQAERLAPGRTIAVYDLGGGTFDATVLRRRADGGFESLGRTEGIERLGGIDVDEAVFGYVLRSLGAGREVTEPADDPGLKTAVAQLRRACVEAKEALSSETSVTIPVWLPRLHHDVLLQRSELEELVGPLLRPTVDALARVVASAGLRPADVDAVLLVGGSSRIPMIAREVSAAFQRPVVVDAHPKHPVALGAALDAAAHAVPAAAPPAPRPAPVVQDAVPGPQAAAGAGTPPYHPLPPLAPPRPPVEMDRSGRRILLLASLATPVVLVLIVVLTVIQGRDAPSGTSTDRTVTPPSPGDGAPTEQPGPTTEEASGTAGGVDFVSDPAPVLAAFGGIYETTPRVRELVLHPDLATIDVQVPGEPTYVDQYEVRAGRVSGPAPQQLLDMEVEDLEAELFDLSEVDAAVIPTAAQQMLESCPGDGFELTHVIIGREPALDELGRVLMLIYASHPVRGGGGYIAYTLDGAPVANHC